MSKKNLNKRTLELESEKDEMEFKGKKFSNSRKNRGKKGRWKGKQVNDPVWHGKNAQITKDLCSLPFNTMSGFPPSAANGIKYMLGVLRSYFIDWFCGISDDFKSMINTAATNIWEFIRSRNSGATNYQSSDIFINVIFGCLDMFATARYLASCFTHATMYSVFNRIIPKTFFEMRKIDYEDFISNIANYRGRFNILIAKMSAVVVPDQFPIYNWIMSLFDNVYKDRDSATGREQLLVSVKSSFHIYDATANPQGGMVRLITPIDIGGSSGSPYSITLTPEFPKQKFSFYLDILEKQIEAIVTDEDCNIIFGDLIKAYGSEGKFFKFSPLSESDKVEPIYSEEFLEQFHNAIFAPKMKTFNVNISTGVSMKLPKYINNIRQDAQGYILSDFAYALGGEAGIDAIAIYDDSYRLLLDTNEMNPSPEKIMNMTRMHNRFKLKAHSAIPSEDVIQISASSALIVWDGELAYVPADFSPVQYKWMGQCYNNGIPTTAALVSNFDWQPILYIRFDTGLISEPNMTVIGDICNIQPVDLDTVARIHDVDFASLYDIPFTGKF